MCKYQSWREVDGVGWIVLKSFQRPYGKLCLMGGLIMNSLRYECIGGFMICSRDVKDLTNLSPHYCSESVDVAFVFHSF
jgi:hypothetical protein